MNLFQPIKQGAPTGLAGVRKKLEMRALNP
jgi:hypothetical protein